MGEKRQEATNTLMSAEKQQNIISTKKFDFDPLKLTDFFNEATVKITYAAAYGQTEVLKCLIYTGKFNPAASDNAPLRFAAKNGQLETIQYLLSDALTAKYPAINPADDDNDAIRWAAAMGHLSVVQYLLSDEIIQKYPDIDPAADDNYALCWAKLNGQHGVVAFLMSDEIQAKFPSLAS